MARCAVSIACNFVFSVFDLYLSTGGSIFTCAGSAIEFIMDNISVLFFVSASGRMSAPRSPLNSQHSLPIMGLIDALTLHHIIIL